MQARLAAERLDVNSQTVRKPNGRVNTWVRGKMGHAFFRFKKKKKKKSRKSLPTPTKVQPRRIPRMEGNSSKETLGAEKLKPALYPDAFPAEDVEVYKYCISQVHAKYFQLDITKSSYEHLSKGRVNVKEVCAVDIPGCRN